MARRIRSLFVWCTTNARIPGARTLGLSMAAVWIILVGAASAQSLNIALYAPVTGTDPHYYTLAPNESLDSDIYERLVDHDAAGHMIGGLAKSWRLTYEPRVHEETRTMSVQP